MKHPPLTRFRNTLVWRLIPTRFPPIDVFRDVAPAEAWSLVQEIEGRTNERLVEQEFSRGYIRPNDRVEGSTSHYILGPLAHPNPEGSRFSDGTFGVVYGALDLETIIKEVKLCREEFLRRTKEQPQRLDMRAILMNLDGELHDLRSELDAKDMKKSESQRLARELREKGSNGLIFNSNLQDGGECVAVFRPPVLSACRQERHLAFIWDGVAVTEILEYSIQDSNQESNAVS